MEWNPLIKYYIKIQSEHPKPRAVIGLTFGALDNLLAVKTWLEGGGGEGEWASRLATAAFTAATQVGHQHLTKHAVFSRTIGRAERPAVGAERACVAPSRD